MLVGPMFSPKSTIDWASGSRTPSTVSRVSVPTFKRELDSEIDSEPMVVNSLSSVELKPDQLEGMGSFPLLLRVAISLAELKVETK
jgi:hypothetical protein